MTKKKMIFLFLIIFSSFVVANTYNNGRDIQREFSLTNDTVALWHFDDGNNSIITDASGNGNTVLLSPLNRPSWTNVSKFGSYALDFDGKKQYALIRDNPSLRFYGNDSFAIEAWVRLRKSLDNTYQVLVMKGSGKSYYALAFDPDGRAIGVLSDGKNSSGVRFDAKPITDGEWHYVSFVRDRQLRQIRIKVDHLLPVSSEDDTDELIVPGDMFIGSSTNYDEHIFGTLDEVRISKSTSIDPPIKFHETLLGLPLLFSFVVIVYAIILTFYAYGLFRQVPSSLKIATKNKKWVHLFIFSIIAISFIQISLYEVLPASENNYDRAISILSKGYIPLSVFSLSVIIIYYLWKTSPCWKGKKALLIPLIFCLLNILIQISFVATRGFDVLPKFITSSNFEYYLILTHEKMLEMAPLDFLRFWFHGIIDPATWETWIRWGTKLPGWPLMTYFIMNAFWKEPISVALATIIVNSLTAFPLFYLAQELYGRRAALIASSLFLYIPSTIIHIPWNDLTVSVLTTTALFLLLRSLKTTGYFIQICLAACAGFMTFLAFFMSQVAGTLLLGALVIVTYHKRDSYHSNPWMWMFLMGLAIIVYDRSGIHRTVPTTIISSTSMLIGLATILIASLASLKGNIKLRLPLMLAFISGFLVMIALVQLGLGMPILKSVSYASFRLENHSLNMERNLIIWAGLSPFDSFSYLQVEISNVYLFLILAGMPILILFLKKIKSDVVAFFKIKKLSDMFALAVCTMILILFTVVRFEMARVGLYFYPLLTVIAAGELAKIQDNTGGNTEFWIIFTLQFLETLLYFSIEMLYLIFFPGYITRFNGSFYLLI